MSSAIALSISEAGDSGNLSEGDRICQDITFGMEFSGKRQYSVMETKILGTSLGSNLENEQILTRKCRKVCIDTVLPIS